MLHGFMLHRHKKINGTRIAQVERKAGVATNETKSQARKSSNLEMDCPRRLVIKHLTENTERRVCWNWCFSVWDL